MRARVRDDYAVQYADPINVAAGAEVIVGRRDDVFSRWLWCRAGDGREGWVPETILSSANPGAAVVLRSYEATELPIEGGAMVDVIEQFDGFAWVRAADGRLGWLPVARLEIAEGRMMGRIADMDDHNALLDVSHGIAAAIGGRDTSRLAGILAPGFVHRAPGGEAIDATGFLRAIGEIPGEIVFVRLETIDVDISGSSALATGIQHAQVRLEGALIDDRRAFVDWFIKVDGEWRILVAVDVPLPPAS